MDLSLVSVVVATYRREKELYCALSSIAQQTYKALEAIVIDDNAEPSWNARVAAVIAQIGTQFPSLSLTLLVNEENLGSARTRNRGIEAARGAYVTFLDDDDVYLPEKVERQLTFMKERELDFSITDLHLYQGDKLFCARTRPYLLGAAPQELLALHLKHHITGTDAIMMERAYLLRIGAFPPIDIGDEFYLMLRAFDDGGCFGYLPVCDVKAFLHEGEGGLSTGKQKKRGERELYRHKKTYFSRLRRWERRYIRMRHFSVLAFSSLRRRCYLGFLWYAALAFLSAPIQCVRLAIKRGA